jgi:hypothetical protein
VLHVGIWLNKTLPDNSEAMVLTNCPDELETYGHMKITIQTSTATLLVVTQNWKKPRCLPLEEEVSKLWSIHTSGYYLAIKRIELYNHNKPWNLNLKCLL